MASDSTVKVTFLGDVTDLKKKVDSAENRMASFTSGVADNAKKIAIGVGAGVAGLGVLAKGAVDAASDLNESMSKVSVVFGESANQITDWSKNAATSLGISQQQALEAAGTFGNLFSAMGLASDQSIDMSKGIVQLSSDLASFNNANPEEVLEALRAGLVGETEPLRKFGVNMSAARVEMEAMRLGLVKYTVNQEDLQKIAEKGVILEKDWADAAKKYGSESAQALKIRQKIAENDKKFTEARGGEAQELDAAAKAQAAYSLILQDTTLAQGDFARTSDGAANQQRILQARLEDTKAKIGNALLPAYTALLTFIIDKLIPGIEKLSGWLGDHKEVMIGVAAGVAAAFGVWAASSIAAAVASQSAAIAAGETTIAAIALQGAILLIPLAVAALVAGLIWAYQNVGWFHDAVDAVGRFLRDTLWPILQTVAGFIMDHVVPAVAAAVGWFIQAHVKVAEFVAKVVEALLPVLEAIASFIRDKVIPAVSEMIGFFVDLGTTVADTATEIYDKFTAIWDGIKAIVEAAVDFVLEQIDRMLGPIDDALGKVGDLVGAVGGAAGGIGGALSGAAGKIPGFASGGVVPGPLGSPQLAVVHGGEEVLTPGQRRGGGVVINITGPVYGMDDFERRVADAAEKFAARNGMN